MGMGNNQTKKNYKLLRQIGDFVVSRAQKGSGGCSGHCLIILPLLLFWSAAAAAACNAEMRKKGSLFGSEEEISMSLGRYSSLLPFYFI